MNKKRAKIPQPNPDKIERPISSKIYPVIDNDLAWDNVENDLPAADLQDLQEGANVSLSRCVNENHPHTQDGFRFVMIQVQTYCAKGFPILIHSLGDFCRISEFWRVAA